MKNTKLTNDIINVINAFTELSKNNLNELNEKEVLSLKEDLQFFENCLIGIYHELNKKEFKEDYKVPEKIELNYFKNYEGATKWKQNMKLDILTVCLAMEFMLIKEKIKKYVSSLYLKMEMKLFNI